MPAEQPPVPGDATPFDDPEAHLATLELRFNEALEARKRGDVDGAADLLRDVLQAEPRLAEPRLELAHLLLEQERYDEAEEHAREAVRILSSGGQWTDDLPEAALQSLAWTTLGETIRLQTDSDDVVFGDPTVWRTRMTEARDAYKRAADLDADNEYARDWAFHLALNA